MEKEVAENPEALDQDVIIRENELVEFDDWKKDALQAISALKSAAKVVSKCHDRAYIQLPRGHLEGMANTIQYPMQKYAVAVQDGWVHNERKILAVFI